MAIIGLWKHALVLLGICIAVSVVAGIVLPDQIFAAVSRGIDFGFAFLYALITNYNYYRLKVKSQSDWNPFQGMRW